MTRFARAKGSKSSNEKTPDDSTPWEVMKQQMLQAKKEDSEAKARQEAEQQRIENYENFLKEHKKQKRKAVWCEFDDGTSKPNKQATPSKAIQINNYENYAETTHQDEQVTVNQTKQSKKPKNHAQTAQQSKANNSSRSSNDEVLIDEEESKKKSINKSENSLETESELKDNKVKNKKKKEKKNKKCLISEDSKQINESSMQINLQKKNKVNAVQSSNDIYNQGGNQEKKIKNRFDGQTARRKPINEQSFQLIINGKEVELVRFDGFPVTKKDAERLQELKQSMINKGIPKSEVQKTMKLERRRAEKALARMKKDVCYNCRKGGHNLSDCPDLKTKIPGAHLADGVCFKCGSTEHRQFECKVQRDKEFRFATCFICKEQGHIARQCPDNPKGLYPNGGGCKLCGDVTHLRKDCPSVNNKKEETSIKLQTLDNTEDLEDIGQKLTQNPSKEISKKPKKIKF